MVIKKLINYIINRFYCNETIVLYNLKSHDAYNPIKSVAIIKHATIDNLKDILYFQPERYIDIFKNFLAQGDKGYFAYIDNKCIHRSWVKTNEQTVYFHWAYPYKLKRNEVFVHYCETAPQARGKNVYPHVLSTIIEEHRNKDVLISINNNNIPSKKGVEKVGFRERERIKIIVVLGFKIIKRIVKDSIG